MSKQRRKRKLKKQQLLRDIQQQRLELSNNTQLWKSITEPYDKGWQKLLSLKPYLQLGVSAISLYGLRHPVKFYRWSRYIIRVLKWK
ncbi:YqjK-like family protein [Photorhabdus heterorhabditis]|uniref:Cell division protein FtsH n=1 Tax=Photorhabdus heterorhabditis TaxID=880156 RepID=A0A5B0WFZ9_9GAMM|nr:YqjK-like family protein [Photorhabdus heterorhabditis]KAA1186044.1 hypothetical protein F0L16_14455 [Photorhabdus heterorhabditis]KOY61049.1 hypothetical protein AM629_15875 [Photorhabdus heterorhabditis]MBS9442858.1 hypothetical protein [Photorhabdus heterorhabditis]NRN30329.1 hypothetical protein [Photorhabdus heterorhabditis subsp. aluminescens]